MVDDLGNYLRTVERAEELDEKIEKIDDLIGEIVYELYGLTDEEIEIKEEAALLKSFDADISQAAC
ncbi:restriction endonuclease [Halorubrum salipaludis]|uniref:Restriction endonuclease n=1 Tax=Halorubrum salipaludis TaxID=2032630 RepID=A0A2A2F315_9EURY|nr:restriction endonuclease [Halorubrum salipaludis]PAU80001.1 restriction endonuclease [Halorubrum salipaludis]